MMTNSVTPANTDFAGQPEVARHVRAENRGQIEGGAPPYNLRNGEDRRRATHLRCHFPPQTGPSNDAQALWILCR